MKLSLGPFHRQGKKYTFERQKHRYGDFLFKYKNIR